MKLIAAIALLLCGVVAFAQDEDCLCLGEWVQVQDGSPYNVYFGPIFEHSEQTLACDPLFVAEHSHEKYKEAWVIETGGRCAVLNWITELQTIYNSSHDIDVDVDEYTIPGGYESREELFFTTGLRHQSFDCVFEGNVQKTLVRKQLIDYNHLIIVMFEEIRECQPDPDPGGPPG